MDNIAVRALSQTATATRHVYCIPDAGIHCALLVSRGSQETRTGAASVRKRHPSFQRHICFAAGVRFDLSAGPPMAGIVCIVQMSVWSMLAEIMLQAEDALSSVPCIRCTVMTSGTHGLKQQCLL